MLNYTNFNSGEKRRQIYKIKTNNMNIIGKYRIEYPDRGIVQYKNLIRHEDYLNDIVPMLDNIRDIEQKYTRKKADALIKPIKAEIKRKYGSHYFTNQSPLFYAIKSGEMKLGPNQGGIWKVIMTEETVMHEGVEFDE